MSPLVAAYAWTKTLTARRLDEDALEAAVTTPPGVVKSLPPVTGILVAFRLYLSGKALLVTLEVRDDTGVVRSRTVTGDALVTLTDPPV